MDNADDPDLNGEYTLINGTKSDDKCIDGCTYKKEGDDDEFCFADQQIDKDPVITCNSYCNNGYCTQTNINTIDIGTSAAGEL